MKDGDIKTSSEKAYHAILAAVLENRLPRDEFLSQRKLSHLAGVSIISVREALKKLEHEGIIEAIPKWGVKIPVPTKKRIVEIYQVREGIEVMVAYLLATSAKPEQKEQLKTLAEACDRIKVEDQESINKFSELHRELHLKMAEFTGNHQLRDHLERLGLRLLIYQSAKYTWFRQVDNWDYWHRGLLDKILSGDPETAQNAMHEHIQHGLRYDLQAFSGMEVKE